MKIMLTVSGSPDKSIFIETDNEQGTKLFHKLAKTLLGVKTNGEVDSAVEAQRFNTHSSHKEEPARTARTSIQDTAGKKPEIIPSRKYRGFMHMKCPNCGEISTFCTKEEVDKFHCFRCGTDVALEGNVHLAFLHCECGNRSKYITNRSDESFDIECIRCGNPVAVTWNRKKHVYGTIREE
jgi:ribosomal protein S27E